MKQKSDSKAMTTLYVTGFGKFHGVETNPTMEILEALKEEGTPLAPLSCVKESFDVLHVSKTGIDEYFDSVHVSHDNISIHFGVNGKGTQFQLEKFCYNNMTFRVPDMCGFEPNAECIDSDCVLDRPNQTHFEVEEVCKKLKEEDGFDVVVSEDPGRYCCNYIYYQSLARQEKLRLDAAAGGGNGGKASSNRSKRSIFIHVPPFSVIDKETQIAFARKAVVRLCSPDALVDKSSAGANLCSVMCGF